MILIDFKIIAMYSNKNVLMQTIFQSVILPNLCSFVEEFTNAGRYGPGAR